MIVEKELGCLIVCCLIEREVKRREKKRKKITIKHEVKKH